MIAGQWPRFLIHDRDTKFGRTFDVVFHGEGVSIIRTPLKTPNANTHIERWVGSLRRECRDRLLTFSRRQLDRVLRVYVRHDNERRRHRARARVAASRLPAPRTPPSESAAPRAANASKHAVAARPEQDRRLRDER